MSADATVALDLADGGFLAVNAGGPLAPASPGYAIVDGGGVVTGRAARARARLTPRRSHDRFWHELDETPLPRPFPRRWTHADLAHRHLADLRREVGIEPERVVAAVPGDRRYDELARLLGIAAAAGWPVGGLIDAAVAAVASAPAFEADVERVWHLDLGLHRAVATELEIGSGVVRRRVLTVDVGLIALERVWARFFARRLVAATRFDPLHSAASEQSLYAAMEGWLDELATSEGMVISLTGGGREHQVEVARTEVEDAASDAYRRIAALVPGDFDPRSCRLLLAARAARLPGLGAVLEAVAGDPVVLPADAAAAGALAASDRILAPDGDPAFVVRLPARERGAA